LIEAGVNQMENAIALETKPELAPWAWYKGAFNQYHSALLLLVEVYAYPMRKDAARIWKCLDYIFDIPPHLSPKQKAELVITDLRDRMEVYHQMRKIKTTNQMEERVVALKEASNRDSASPPSAFAEQGLSAVNPPQDPVMSGNMPGMLPANFSPPPAAPTESSGSGSRHGSVQAAADIQMGAMEDIDWVRDLYDSAIRFKANYICRPNGINTSRSNKTPATSTSQTSTSQTSLGTLERQWTHLRSAQLELDSTYLQHKILQTSTSLKPIFRAT
jgi:hypothetical protein